MPTELRRIFDEDAELYSRARPGYPPELFTGLAELTGLGPTDPGTGTTPADRAGSGAVRVLEIAPGTGQATFELARLATDLTAVELGPALAGVLDRRMTPPPAGLRFQLHVGGFEEWTLPAEPFDLVACFTAWHWLKPGIRSAKVAAALSPGGSLVTVATEHVRGGTTEFFNQAQEAYLRWDPATPPGLQLQEAASIPPIRDEVDDDPAFGPAVRRRCHQEIDYSADEYLDVLNTYSGHRALSPERRSGLLGDLRTLIDEGYGGTVTKAYLYEMRVARRR